MGLAILWIMLFHTRVYFGTGLGSVPLNFFKEVGYGGADVFFFLSGLGLMHGWMARPSTTGAFYRRRLRRLLPAYWLIAGGRALGGWLSGEGSLLDVPLALCGLDYLVWGVERFWFIPAITVCYLLFPLIAVSLARAPSPSVRWLRVAAWTGASWLLMIVAARSTASHLVLLLARLPLFVLGAALVMPMRPEQPDARPTRAWGRILAPIVAGAALFVVWRHVDPARWWRPAAMLSAFWLIAPPLSALTASALGRLSSVTRAPLRALGRDSLELYLVHVLVFELGAWLYEGPLAAWTAPLPARGQVVEYALLGLISLPLAWLLARSLAPLRPGPSRS
jgi:peptidoglycan/LPS O-acetylase OafA/YrhL